MQEFNFKPKKIMGEGGRGEGYMSGSKNIKTQRWDSYMPCVAMAHSTKSISSSKWSLLLFAISISVKFTIVIVISLPDIPVDLVTEILVISFSISLCCLFCFLLHSALQR